MSKHTKSVIPKHDMKNNFKFTSSLSIKNLKEKYNNKYFKKKIDLMTVEKFPLHSIPLT